MGPSTARYIGSCPASLQGHLEGLRAVYLRITVETWPEIWPEVSPLGKIDGNSTLQIEGSLSTIAPESLPRVLHPGRTWPSWSRFFESSRKAARGKVSTLYPGCQAMHLDGLGQADIDTPGKANGTVTRWHCDQSVNAMTNRHHSRNGAQALLQRLVDCSLVEQRLAAKTISPLR